MKQMKAWERQGWESSKAWAAFQVYRDLGKQRSISSTQKTLGRPPGYIRVLERFCSKNNWVQRCRDYDDYCDKHYRIENERLRREEYQTRLEQYWKDKERITRADISITIKARQFVQQQLILYLQNPEPRLARIGELSALIRSIVILNDSADEAMRAILENEGKGSRSESELILIKSDDPAELIKEHQRLLDELDAD